MRCLGSVGRRERDAERSSESGLARCVAWCEDMWTVVRMRVRVRVRVRRGLVRVRVLVHRAAAADATASTRHGSVSHIPRIQYPGFVCGDVAPGWRSVVGVRHCGLGFCAGGCGVGQEV